MISRLNKFHEIYKKALRTSKNTIAKYIFFLSLTIVREKAGLSWTMYEICLCHSFSIVQVIATNVIAKVNATNIIKV